MSMHTLHSNSKVGEASEGHRQNSFRIIYGYLKEIMITSLN